MITALSSRKALLLASTAVSAVGAATLPAAAGGFDVREQSAYYQGMSFAGSAAGGNLSSMFWNPAAAGDVGAGLTTNSNYSLILPRSDISVDGAHVNTPFGPIGVPLAGDTTTDMAQEAIVPASYAAYRYNSNLVFAISMNSQFGLGTSPGTNDEEWAGQLWARSSKVFSINATPTVAYQVSDQLTVAAGVQVQYLELTRFKAATALAGPVPSSVIEGDDIGVGFTLGVEFKPAPGTTIGIGYRSSISHDLEGSVAVPAAGLKAGVHADLDLPDKVTGSFRQDLTQNLRLLGTVEWTNWSKLGVIPITLDDAFGLAPPGFDIANLDFQWEDGWFFSLGTEYDYSEKLTLRGGIAYEISPIQSDTSRLIQLPDADRIWLSAGASYHIGNLFGMGDSTVDLAYTHVFVEEANFDRVPSSALAPAVHITGSADSAVDIISMGMTTKW